VTWTLFIEILFYAMVACLINRLRVAPARSTLEMILGTAAVSLAYTQSMAFHVLNLMTTPLLLLLVGRVFYLHWSKAIRPDQTLVLFALSFGLYLVLLSSIPTNSLFAPPHDRRVVDLLIVEDHVVSPVAAWSPP
jgi:peptidoglycan/LPS O-acetylase OafA/YrhL